MAEYDLSACIEYVLEKTGSQKLSYIGHGSGTTEMFAALCENTDFFRERVNIFCMMGPITYLRNCQANIIH